MNEIEINKAEAKKIEIRDNSKRARTLLIVFGILIGLTLFELLLIYNELQVLKNTQIGEYAPKGKVSLNDLRKEIVGLIQSVFYIASIVVFLNWFRRAYGNLHRVGVNLNYKESMAVWTWVIPIIFLYRPVLIMREIWIETQKKIKEFVPTYIIKKGGLIIGLWWALVIVSNFIGRYVLKFVFKQDTIQQLIKYSEATLISKMIQIPEALLVIFIVYKLSKMETKLADEVKKIGGNILHKR